MELQSPTIYNDSSNGIRVIMEILGAFAYCKLGWDKLSEEEVILKYSKENMNKLSEMYEFQVDALVNENSILKKKLEDNISQHQKEIEQSIEQEKIHNSFVISKLKQDKIIIENSIEKSVNDKLLVIEEKHKMELSSREKEIELVKEKLNASNEKQHIYNELIGKRVFKNNTEQGVYGENFIDEVVNVGLSCDKAAEVIDSSKVGGSGDRVIKFSNGKTLMIEVKYKDRITPEDRDQFIQHYQKDFEEKKCESALFLSLKTEQIPTKGDKPILNYSDKVGYYGISDDFSLAEKRFRVDRCIAEMFHKMNQMKDFEEISDNNHIYNKLLESYVKQKKECERVCKVHKYESDKNNDNLTSIHQQINDIYREIRKNNITVDKKFIDEKVYLQELKKSIKDWVSLHNIVFKKGGSHNKQIIDEMTTLSSLDKEYVLGKKIKLQDIH